MAARGKLGTRNSVILDIPAALASSSYGSHNSSEVCFSEYYYTLVFPNTPHDLTDVAGERISFAQAKAIIREVTCGGEANKTHAVNEFIQAWVEKFRSVSPIDVDTIPVGYFRELMRNIVIQRLESIPGLSLVTFTSSSSSSSETKGSLVETPKESNSDAEYIYCLIRVSRDLLFQQADLHNLLVPIWPEVDPGSERELNRMFLQGETQADEAQLFDDESPAMVSRRIHAIQRIADRSIQPCYHPSPHLYFPFRNHPAYQYLYRHLESSCQANMPFRIVDKIRVTKGLIDGEFNCDLLRKHNFLVHHMCVHSRDPSDEDEVTLDMLCDQWGSLTSLWHAWSHGHCRHLLGVLYYQPIDLIRHYFGEQLALYKQDVIPNTHTHAHNAVIDFAFLSFYAAQMVPLVALGLAAPLMKFVLRASHLVYYNTGLAVFNCLYAARLLRKWKVQQRWYACIWGMEEVVFDNSVRAEYVGSIRISPINNLPEILAPASTQGIRRLQSSTLLWMAIAIDGALIYGVFALQHYVEAQWTSHSMSVYSYIAIAFIINLSQSPFHAVVVYLNEWENHRTTNQYDVALTVKCATTLSLISFFVCVFTSNVVVIVSTFQTLNYFGPILFSMFFKPYLFGCNSTKLPSLDAAACATETANLLLVVLLFNFLLSMRDIAGPLVDSISHAVRTRYQYATRLQSTYVYAPPSPPLPPSIIVPPTLDAEVQLEAYDGVLFDYAQIAITFGYVSWFAAASPQAAIVAFAITLVQRPFPVATATIGGWTIYFNMICLGGVVVNAATVVLAEMLTHQAHMKWEAIPTKNWLSHLFSLTILMAVLYALALTMTIYDTDDRSKLHHIKSLQTRQEYLRNVYLYQLTKSTSSRERPRGGIYLNGVYRYIISGDVDDGDQVDELRDELHVLERAIRLERPDESETIGTFHVVVVGANILPVMDRSTKALDGFVKVKLKLGDKVLPSKHKTAVKRKTRSPVWNAAFEFKIVSLDTLVHLEVMDWNMVGKSDHVGLATMPVTSVLPTSTDFADADIDGTCDMVAVDIPVDLADGLLESMAKDIPKFGRPVLHVSMGVKLNAQGCVHLRHHNRKRRVQAILQDMQTYLVWKSDDE
ncbi:hypothetical protein DYB30_001549 [Aphanomyces astaci]|uniref:C2 domain-containing protein n=1 Tax=Aphanomyces astaci TaxID=112090 RepID=A0A397D290_APHAT|nr:hypothetical protein DYB30_001549 [Aphanomyces astaci]RHY59066.1 hypothetical protein DYB34_004840 [Aphanomyces astaci]